MQYLSETRSYPDFTSELYTDMHADIHKHPGQARFHKTLHSVSQRDHRDTRRRKSETNNKNKTGHQNSIPKHVHRYRQIPRRAILNKARPKCPTKANALQTNISSYVLVETVDKEGKPKL